MLFKGVEIRTIEFEAWFQQNVKDELDIIKASIKIIALRGSTNCL